ncbi:MAG: adenosylmethionine-8-amino-7-oxononanoate aminotransferase [Litorivivens sp.]|jgi:adenosylmethionine-8-amino-7-oxononanoate aminotransferase
MLSDSQKKFDRDHIWHPYTSLTNPQPVYAVESADGVRLKLDDGRQLIDGMSSWWCAIHGYNHPALNAAIVEQTGKMAHVMFGGITHEPAIELCKRLVDMTPEGLEKVFLCDSGSISVEVALKMTFQYWHSRGNSKKPKLLTIKKGYHGDTFGAMSVCDPEGGMHHLFADMLPQHIFMNAPTSSFAEGLNPTDLEELESTFEKHHEEIAAFILEPIVQGAGGMRMYSPEFLVKARALCDQYDVLLIFDEIATGFGRTGKLFAANHADVSPDIMCVGKALTGGMMTMAATICTTKVAEIVCESEAGVFMHGPTFMANPLACAVSIASLDILSAGQWKTQVGNIESWLEDGLRELAFHANVVDVRVMGAIGVVECTQNINTAEIQKYFVQEGVWIRPFRNLIYLMPPFIADEGDIAELCHAIKGSLAYEHHFEQIAAQTLED